MNGVYSVVVHGLGTVFTLADGYLAMLVFSEWCDHSWEPGSIAYGKRITIQAGTYVLDAYHRPAA